MPSKLWTHLEEIERLLFSAAAHGLGGVSPRRQERTTMLESGEIFAGTGEAR
jgi:hypothetical protein